MQHPLKYISHLAFSFLLLINLKQQQHLLLLCNCFFVIVGVSKLDLPKSNFDTPTLLLFLLYCYYQGLNFELPTHKSFTTPGAEMTIKYEKYDKITLPLVHFCHQIIITIDIFALPLSRLLLCHSRSFLCHSLESGNPLISHCEEAKRLKQSRFELCILSTILPRIW